MTTTLYNYDPRGLFVGTSIAELDPVDNLPLIPRYSTLDPVIDVAEGQVAAYYNKVWHAKPDNSGDWYLSDGTKVTLTHPLDDQPINSTRIAPPDQYYNLYEGEWVLDNARAQSARDRILKSVRNDRDTILLRLNGIQMDASFNGVSQSVIDAIMKAKQQLKDITAIPEIVNTYDPVQVEEAAKKRFSEIKLQLESTAFIALSAFNGII